MNYFKPNVTCKLIFTNEHFDKRDVGNLMRLIWTNSGHHGKKFCVCRLYKRLAINALKKKWLHDFYVDFDMVVAKLCWCDKEVFPVSKCSNPHSLFLVSFIDKYESTT